MAEMTFIDEGDGGEDEAPYWSHDFDVFGTDPDLSSAGISTTVEIFHRENQVNFVMDLFHQRVDQSHTPDRRFHLDMDLGLEFCTESYNLGAGDGDDVDTHGCGFDSADCGDEFFGWRRDSRAETEESSNRRRGTVISNPNNEIGVSGIDLNSNGRRERVISQSDEEIEAVGIDFDPFFGDDDRSSVQICWDSFRLEDQREGVADFEWEEVDGRVDEQEVPSVFFGADVDDDMDDSVVREIVSVLYGADVDDDVDASVAMEEELDIDQVRDFEWEVLLNNQNVDTNADDEYEMLVGQFLGTEAQKPPASKAVVEALVVVVLTEDDVEGQDLSCAVCKDDVVIGEKAKVLPCLHKYHEGCINPWLGMRNTCPVCRFELPTDDPEYERRRVERERIGRA